jgi:hypothetical protein
MAKNGNGDDDGVVTWGWKGVERLKQMTEEFDPNQPGQPDRSNGNDSQLNGWFALPAYPGNSNRRLLWVGGVQDPDDDDHDSTKPITFFQTRGATDQELAEICELLNDPKHLCVKDQNGKWTDNGLNEALIPLLEQIETRWEDETGFRWSVVPEEITEDEHRLLAIAEGEDNLDGFQAIVDRINNRIEQGEADRKRATEENRRKQATEENRRNRYYPVPRLLPPVGIGNCLDLEMLAVIAWHGRSGKGCWAKPSTYVEELGLVKRSDPGEKDRFRANDRVRKSLSRLDRARLTKTRGKVGSTPVRLVNFPFSLKGQNKAPHLRLACWVACRPELSVTAKLVWAACDDLDRLQAEWGKGDFVASASEIASRLPLAVTRWTVNRALEELEAHRLLEPSGDGWHLLRDEESNAWFWDWYWEQAAYIKP